MALNHWQTRAAVLAIGLTLASATLADDRAKPARADAPVGSAAIPTVPELRTVKERLGRKWMDEQRIDNCKVPLDKRGAKPRVDTCPGMS
jgi:hypothetical protein